MKLYSGTHFWFCSSFHVAVCVTRRFVMMRGYWSTARSKQTQGAPQQPQQPICEAAVVYATAQMRTIKHCPYLDQSGTHLLPPPPCCAPTSSPSAGLRLRRSLASRRRSPPAKATFRPQLPTASLSAQAHSCTTRLLPSPSSLAWQSCSSSAASARSCSSRAAHSSATPSTSMASRTLPLSQFGARPRSWPSR